MLIAHLACAMYWFHPLAWVLARRSRHEQELACDDAVLASGLEPAGYAEALVATARELTSTKLIGCHMLTGRNLKSRIARLFDSGVARIPSRAGLRGAVAASVAAIVIVGMLVSARQARAGDDQIYPIGNGVTQPILLTKVEPEYTEEARAARLQGTVSLEAVLTKRVTPQISESRMLSAWAWIRRRLKPLSNGSSNLERKTASQCGSEREWRLISDCGRI